jgi:hypothetical protein
MNMHRVVCVTVGVLLIAEASRYKTTLGQERDDKDGRPVPMSQARSARELAARIRNLLSSSPTGELDHLVAAADCSVALAAGWERVCRTLPVEEQNELVVPDRQAISRFLGLLEGRIQFPIPTAWESAVKSAKAYSQRNFLFSVPKHGGEPSPGHGLLRRAGDRWIVKKDSQLIKLPPADGGSGPINYAAVELADEWAYTALYGPFPIPYTLSATDRGSGKIIWSSKVWANGDWGAYSGTGGHFIIIRSTREEIAVFGITSFGSAYVEVFDKKTGENRCRFCTRYSDENAPRK